jgi:glycosyltransferase involved in cell wall biosynthesis
MRILWIATKLPWPSVDGGRLAQALTLEALAAEGAELTVVAPEWSAAGPVPAPPEIRVHAVRAAPRPLAWALLAGLATGRPLAIARHALPAVRRTVRRVLAAPSADAAHDVVHDVVHVEQLQAWPASAPAAARGVRRLLRCQNVESDLLVRQGGWGVLRMWEAPRLARFEGRAVAAADAAVALTAQDAGRLAELAGGRPVAAVPPPFPARLPTGPPLSGDPAVVLLGSGGWRPNRVAGAHFLGGVWPEIAARLPAARLHVFGLDVPLAAGERVTVHPAPADSRLAFAAGSVLVVPLLAGSGLRMKILEAWARGVPVVATPEAAAGLPVVDGGELLLVRRPEEFAAALARLQADPALGAALTAAGRAVLAARFAPRGVARQLLELYGPPFSRE